ncbi:MAG: penicillin-binding protein 2 [Gemmatimonadetes bacterium]|nr:penicillin-binding protein 2 [Gemmatimonadota bacterium]
MQHPLPQDERLPLKLLLAPVILLFAILLLRLFYLQVVTSADYARESEENRIAQRRVKAPRGLIYDRDGRILARTRPFYTVALERTTRKDFEAATAAFTRAIGDIELDGEYSRKYRTIRLKRDVDFRTVSIVEERLKADWPLLDIEIETQRYYPYGTAAAHLLGYIGIIRDQDLQGNNENAYVLGDFIGKTGIEKVYENSLRGRDGMMYVEIDATGRTGREFPERDRLPVPGAPLHLTLDLEVQLAAERALPDSFASALVALDPRTGAVLAWASKPTFDPNIFVSFQAQKERRRVLQSETVLLNRALQGHYPPGSTFKMVSAIAALETGVTDTRSLFEPCYGALRVGRSTFRCHKRTGHGSLTLLGAIEVSCNVYFYHLARLMSIETWHKFGAKLGFGQPTGITYPGEAAGLLPSRQYHEERGGWSFGHLLNLSIGQGSLLVTPMQMARYVAAIANGGYLVTPYVSGDPPRRQRIDGISSRTLSIVRKAMRRVVASDTGTGRQARVDGVAIAAKTGTAQVPSRDDDAWMVAFAPYEKPAIAIAAVVEGGGSGGARVGPVVREVVKAFCIQEGIIEPEVTEMDTLWANQGMP